MHDEMKWDEHPLGYGYIVKRLPSGAWWHMHFGRSALSYHCELLGRASNILASIQLLQAGVTTVTPRFMLTLDAEGVELSPNELRMNYRWNLNSDSTDMNADTLHFQQEIMPLIYDSETFQHTVRHIVEKQAYIRKYTHAKP